MGQGVYWLLVWATRSLPTFDIDRDILLTFRVNLSKQLTFIRSQIAQLTFAIVQNNLLSFDAGAEAVYQLLSHAKWFINFSEM